jgi:hypothetical protein
MPKYLLILDSNAIDACEPSGAYGYLRSRSDLQLVPARIGREESERAPSPPTPPLGPTVDAPAPLILNNLQRRLNDPGVTLYNLRAGELTKKLAALYLHPENHDKDIQIAATAIAHGEKCLEERSAIEAYFVTGDENCAKKAHALVSQEGLRVGVLYAMAPTAKKDAPGVRKLRTTFPP